MIRPATAPTMPATGGWSLPSLDGYRAVAAFAVLVTHVSFATGFNGHGRLGALFARLDVGVAVFFVLSGFLLYRPWVAAAREGHAGPSLRRYAKRRVARIYPAYWVVLAVVLLQTRELFHGARGLLAQVALLHTWWPDTALGPPATTTAGVAVHPLGQAWTLAAEVVFYLALPGWAALMARGTARVEPERRWRVEAVGIAGLVVIAQVWRWWLLRASLSGQQVAAMTSWVFNNLDQFAFGMGLAVLSVELGARRRRAPSALRWRTWSAACWVGAAVCLYGAVHWAGLHPTTVLYDVHQQFARQWFYGGVAVLALAPAVLGPATDGWVARLMGHSALRALGRISFGIYLWQELVLYDWMRWRGQRVFTGSFPATLAVVSLLTAAVAAASWFAVERPILRAAR
jgi:peptidoglycan/LPS O-acetylase OafA/YrhL